MNLNFIQDRPKAPTRTRGPGMFPVPEWNHYEDLTFGLAVMHNTSEGKIGFSHI
jgi:hypothetical protein